MASLFLNIFVMKFYERAVIFVSNVIISVSVVIMGFQIAELGQLTQISFGCSLGDAHIADNIFSLDLLISHIEQYVDQSLS